MDLSKLIPPTTVAVQAQEAPQKLEVARYYYPSSDERDPFAPLSGSASYSGRSNSQMVFQNFANLELRGIMRDRKGKIAVIGATSGEAFVLKSGRIYDQRNHLINGVTGIIKESSVVLISSNRTVKELPLKRSAYYR